jgi:hypothetical protein
VNVRPVIAALVSARMATLHELQTVYSVVDAYDMFEVLLINSHNATKARNAPKVK